MQGTASSDFERNYWDRPKVWVAAQNGASQLKRVRLTVEMLPGDSKSVLDVGCGSGPVTNQLAKRFPFTAGVDIARGLLHHVEAQKVQGSALDLPFKQGSFDAVVATELLEHLSRKMHHRIREEIERVARRYVLLSVPLREALQARHVKCMGCGYVFHIDLHTDSFTETRMKNLLEPAFKCVCLQTMGRMEKRMPRLFSTMAHAFGGFIEVDGSGALCPQCGNERNFVHAQNLMTRFFWGIPLRVLPLKKYPRWIVALYERKDDHGGTPYELPVNS